MRLSEQIKIAAKKLDKQYPIYKRLYTGDPKKKIQKGLLDYFTKYFKSKDKAKKYLHLDKYVSQFTNDGD